MRSSRTGDGTVGTREARGADTLSCHAVAVGAILALAHLLTGLAVKPRGARLVAVEA